jgi:hypothetical protein
VDQTSEDVARTAPAGRRARSGRVKRGAVCAVTVALVVVAVGVWVRGGGSGQAGAPSPTTAPLARPAPKAAVLPTPAPPAEAARLGHTPPAPPRPAPRPEPILHDGRHPVFLTDLDITGSTVQFDLVRYLTGDAARDYGEKHEYDPGFFQYDNYTINDNPRLRRLPVTSGLPVTVLRTMHSAIDPHPIPFADLPGYVDDIDSPGHLGGSIFWLTVRNDSVVAMEEQYAP